MTHFRFIPLAVVLTSATLLAACNTAPTTPMGTASASNMATPDQMARMDAQMKAMQGMTGDMGAHHKMMAKRMEMMQMMMQMMMDRESAAMPMAK